MPEGDLLLIDDDVDLCTLMSEFLMHNEFAISFAHDGRHGLSLALDKSFDLLILDVMMPVLDGFQVLQQVRKRSSVPVIMLTARTHERDRIAGLNAGADDYLPKPFGPEELLARIRAVLRRCRPEGNPTATFHCGEFRVEPQTRKAWRGESALELTSIEFDIFEYLIRATGRIVSRDELMAVLYQRPSTPYERSLDVHISHLRKKLSTNDPSIIRTVRGVGYLLASHNVLSTSFK
jgi:two-component system response regulator CpxR